MKKLVIILFCTFSLTVFAQELNTVENNEMVVEQTVSGNLFSRLFIGNIIIGMAEFLMSLIIGLCAIFFAYRSVLKRFKFTDKDLQKQKMSAAIIAAGSIISIAVIGQSLIYPVFSLFQTLKDASVQILNVLTLLLFLIGYLVIAFGISTGAILLGIWAFDKLTKKIDEAEEIKADNQAVAIVFAAVMIALSFYFKIGLESLLVTLLPGLQVRIL